jgi:O-antigen/teichoic acid export membrane protein
VITWVTLAATFGQLSLGQVAIHRATALRGSDWLSSTLGSLLLLGAGVTAGTWLAAGAVFLLTHGRFFHGLDVDVLCAGFLNLPGLVWEQYGSSLLIALDRVAVYNRVQMIGRSLALGLVGLAWLARLGVVGVLVAMLLAQAVIAALLLRALLRLAGGPIRPTLPVVRALVTGGLRLHPNYVGGALITSSSVLVVNNFLGASATGQFQLALQLVTAMMVLPQATAMIAFGRVASVGPELAWGDHRKMVALVAGVVTAGGVVAFMLAPTLVPFLFGSKFSPSIGIFRILLLAVIGMSTASAMSPQWVGRGLFGLMSAITLGLGILNLALVIWLVPLYGVRAAAWSLVGVYFVAFACQAGMAGRCEWAWRRQARERFGGE